jgi:small redox-active disulfide protein 2
MQILVIGPGCSRCKTLAQLTEQAVKELGVTAEINKVTDLEQIMALGVMMTPALAVNGNIKVAGKVPSITKIKAILQHAAA